MLKGRWCHIRTHMHCGATQSHWSQPQARWQRSVTNAVNLFSTKNPTQSFYEPLAPKSGRSNTIRLLEILPASSISRSTVHCRLHHISLSQPPPYSAVSYVWGSLTNTQTLIVNDEPLSVGVNIWHFLHQLREEEHKGLLWIDAICINQKDVGERSQQVAIMGQIYSRAHDVKVWLGSGDECIIQLLKKVRTIDWPRAKEIDDPIAHRGEPWLTESFRNLLRLSVLEYWKRLWIVEEFFLAQHIELRYGTENVDAQRLRQALGRVKAFHQMFTADHVFDDFMMHDSEVVAISNMQTLLANPPIELLPHDTGLEGLAGEIINSPMSAIFTARDYYQGWGCEWAAFNFPALVARYADSHCLDSRDHVYALLPLAEGSAMSLDIVPDYRRSAVNIFEDMIELQLKSFRMAAALENPPSEAKAFMLETVLSIRDALRLDGKDERVKDALRVLKEGLQIDE